MNVTIGMIVLNEEEYLPRNLEQHYPLADRIVIVEGADRLYPSTRVTRAGLSADQTAEIVRNFPDPDKKITFIQHGWTSNNLGAQGKCELRNRYMEYCLPGLLVVLDADEFYRREDFAKMVKACKVLSVYNSWQYPSIHFWRHPGQFITGGYYDVPHIRFWRVTGGGHERYNRNHNIPERHGVALTRYPSKRYYRQLILESAGYQFQGPCCYHFGFAKQPPNMSDKTAYYRARGEDVTRRETTLSRAAWFGADDPAELAAAGLRLWRYGGPLPEVFSPAVAAAG